MSNSDILYRDILDWNIMGRYSVFMEMESNERDRRF